MLSTVLLARFCGCLRIMTWTGRSARAQAGMRQYRMQATVELPVEAHIEVNAPAQRNLQVHLPLIPASETGPIQEITGRDTDAILSPVTISPGSVTRRRRGGIRSYPEVGVELKRSPSSRHRHISMSARTCSCPTASRQAAA